MLRRAVDLAPGSFWEWELARHATLLGLPEEALAALKTAMEGEDAEEVRPELATQRLAICIDR